MRKEYSNVGIKKFKSSRNMRIAISAYACLQNRGSEWEIGWRAVMDYLSEKNELFVFSAGEHHNPNIEKQFDLLNNKAINLYVLDFPLPFVKLIKRIPFIGFQLHAYLWEIKLFFFMKRRFSKSNFDRAIKSSYGNFRYPSFLWYFTNEFYIDPISGGNFFPVKFMNVLSFKAKTIEIFRYISQLLPYLDPLVILTFSKADKIFTASEGSKWIFPKIIRKKCIVKENFLSVNQDDFKIEEASNVSKLDSSVLRIFFTGRMNEWKGVMLVLKALVPIKDKMKYEVNLMGKGYSLNYFKRFVSFHELHVNFISPDSTPRSELSFYFKSHDIFAFPTLHGDGGFAPVEAKLHDMVVLTLDISGLENYLDERDIVIKSKNKKVHDVISNISEQLIQYYRKHKIDKQK